MFSCDWAIKYFSRIKSLFCYWQIDNYLFLACGHCILLTMSFKEQRLTFSFVDHYFGLGLTQSHKDFLLCFLPEVLLSFIEHYEPLWVDFHIWYKLWIKNFLHIWISNSSSIIGLNYYPFFTEFFLHLCQNSVVCVHVGLFLDSILFVSVYGSNILSWLLWFYNNYRNQIALILFVQSYLTYSRSFAFLHRLRINLLISTKNGLLGFWLGLFLFFIEV